MLGRTSALLPVSVSIVVCFWAPNPWNLYSTFNEPVRSSSKMNYVLIPMSVTD